MRILKPEIAKARKEKILRWVIQQFVETRRPVGSQMIAQGALQDVSSATIRNIMKELEEEGYLYQPHTSGGRIPTDKAYRYYVDYLANVQKMAARERQRIEEQYDARVNEVDNILVQTSRLLAMLSGRRGGVCVRGPRGRPTYPAVGFYPGGSGDDFSRSGHPAWNRAALAGTYGLCDRAFPPAGAQPVY